MPPKILVISGPTASGKTALAVELALLLGGAVWMCIGKPAYAAGALIAGAAALLSNRIHYYQMKGKK